MSDRELYKELGLKIIYLPDLIGFKSKFELFCYKSRSYYYVVQCNLPLGIATKLWEETRTYGDVRAGGHGNNLPPATQADYYHKVNGKRLANKIEQEKFLKIVEAGHVAKSIYDEYVFAAPEEYENIGDGFVETYHLDREDGLRRFFNFINKYIDNPRKLQ